MTEKISDKPSGLCEIPLGGTESYVLRIYRRGNKDSFEIVGLLQSVETQEQRAFTSLDELKQILKFGW